MGMTKEKRVEMRKLIDNPISGWHRYGIIDDEPNVLHWNKELEIAYEDMDGEPKKCDAIYVHEFASTPYFQATTGQAKGLKISNVFAYRYIDE